MKRTTKKERERNARDFYQFLWNGYKQKAAIVIQRQDTNIHRVQFIASIVNGPASNVVIAESADGIAGCFYELIKNIHGDIPQVNYFHDDFKAWLKKTCHMDIVWNDGLVMMIEYKH